MAKSQETIAAVWSIRLAADLSASDENARELVSGLTEEQLNWQPAPGSWSVGQCLEHLCKVNEIYVPPISAALQAKPDSPVDQIIPGWFGSWFIRTFIDPSPSSNRVRFWNPFLPGLRFTVGTGFEIIARHERRHLLQAERVLGSTNFPRSKRH